MIWAIKRSKRVLEFGLSETAAWHEADRGPVFDWISCSETSSVVEHSGDGVGEIRKLSSRKTTQIIVWSDRILYKAACSHLHARSDFPKRHRIKP